MKKIIKGLLVGLCCLCMNIQAQTSGTCGDVVFWKYDSLTRTLTVYGAGVVWDMYGYGERQPYKHLRAYTDHIIIEEGITELSFNAFLNIITTTVSLPKTLTHIGSCSFLNNHLESFTIPENVKTLGRAMIGSGSYKLKEIINRSKEPQGMWTREFEYDGSPLEYIELNSVILYVPDESIEKYKVADGWKDFENIKGIREIMCGDSARWSFEDGILRVWGVGEIQGVYADRTKQSWIGLKEKIKEVHIEEGITEIGYGAFAGVNMNSITIPETVTDIGVLSFDSCENLTKIFNLANTPQKIQRSWSHHTFSGSNVGSITVYVPDESVGKYKTAEGWKDFYAIKGIQEYEWLVKGVEILSRHDNVHVGESARLSHQVLPSIAKNKNVFFSSNNPKVVSIDINTGFMKFLSEGEAIITVTTEEGGFKASTTIKVRYLSKNANLESLELNFDIKPAFDKNITDYYATVNSDIDRAIITAGTEDEYATAIITSQTLEEGNNELTLRVTAEASTVSKNYYLHVHRKSSEQRLKSLTPNQGQLQPEFNPDIEEYTWKVVRKQPYMKLVPVPMHDSVKVQTVETTYINDTVLLIRVKAEDERLEKQYKIKVEALGENAYLKDLRVEGFKLNPEFQKNVGVYDLTVPNTTKEVNVIALPEDSNATVSGHIGLQPVGTEMRLLITVEAEDGVSHYTSIIRIQKALATAIEKVEGVSDERVRIYTVDGRYLGVTERENKKIVIPDWLGHGVFIAKGSIYREKFTN